MRRGNRRPEPDPTRARRANGGRVRTRADSGSAPGSATNRRLTRQGSIVADTERNGPDNEERAHAHADAHAEGGEGHDAHAHDGGHGHADGERAHEEHEDGGMEAAAFASLEALEQGEDAPILPVRAIDDDEDADDEDADAAEGEDAEVAAESDDAETEDSEAETAGQCLLAGEGVHAPMLPHAP